VRQAERPDRRHVASVKLADGVLPQWYESEPPVMPRIPMTPEIAERAKRYPANPYEAFTEWNREFLTEMVCMGVTDYGLGAMNDVYVFTPAEPGRYPIYRNPPLVSPPGWFVTNRYGWRGPDYDFNKDGRTIRIVFVGASTTIGAYYLAHSYPEYLDHWLNLWLEKNHPDVHAQVLNASRTGIDDVSMSAIVRQEVAPLEPDLVVYHNSAPPLSEVPSKFRGSRPKFTFRPPSTIEQYSALARRVVSFTKRFSAVDGREPSKPGFSLNWPAGVDRENPNPDSPVLPMSLNVAVKNLDSMKQAAEAAGGELAVESHAWMIPDSRQDLDLKQHLGLYQYLNQQLWPISYDQLRVLTAFQNKLLRAYAAKRGVAYLPLAEALPQDPDLFSDPIHMGESGLRLQGWIMFQQLVPWVEARLRSGRLPRPMRTARTAHPAIPAGVPERVSIEAVKEMCH
jgi:hypothetical protein